MAEAEASQVSWRSWRRRREPRRCGRLGDATGGRFVPINARRAVRTPLANHPCVPWHNSPPFCVHPRNGFLSGVHVVVVAFAARTVFPQ
jgi:hypothetical protein